MLPLGRLSKPQFSWKWLQRESGGTGANQTGVAADLLSVKNSLYSLFTRPFGYEATFLENKRGNFETGFVETSDGFGTGALKYGLDALNVVTFGRGGGVTGGILAKSGAGTSVINGSKELLKANKEAGKVGEDFLKNAFGGSPQVSIGIGKTGYRQLDGIWIITRVESGKNLINQNSSNADIKWC